jgi:hypothetical protein
VIHNLRNLVALRVVLVASTAFILTLVNSTFYNSTSIFSVAETNETNNQERGSDADQVFWAQLGVIVAIISVILSVGLAVILYLHQQNKQRSESIRRSSEAIVQEMEATKRALNSEEYEKIQYKIQISDGGQGTVKYTNAYLDTEAYKSVLHSGFFTFFSANTQHKLTLLYGRIQSHNELISYVDHFQDLYFMNHDNSKENVDEWYQKVQRYDVLLTKWEEEITQLLGEVKNLIESEQPR